MAERARSGPDGVLERTGRVSVVMPVLNAAETLELALRSVLAEPEVGEVIYVDDGSTDGSVEIARGVGDPRVRIVPGPRSGLAGVYNAGWEAATLDFVATCDADDLYIPGRLAWQVAFLDRAPGYVAVAGAFATADSRLRVRVPMVTDRPEGDIDAELRDGDPVSHHCAWLMRREEVLSLGGRRPWFEIGDDLDLLCRIGFLGKVRFVPEVAYVYRIYETSITKRLTQAKMTFFEDAVRTFARQRRETGTDDLDAGCPPVFDPDAHSSTIQSASEQFAGHLMTHAHRLRQQGRTGDALRAAMWAVRMRTSDANAWRTLLGVSRDWVSGGFRRGEGGPG